MTREENTRDLMIQFGNCANGGFDTDAFIDQFCREHRTLQQNIFRELIKLMAFIASDEYHTDGRNDASKKLAKKFIEGYAEMVKKEEIGYLIGKGYTAEQAEEKGEIYRKQVIENPKMYIGLPFI
jgi:hypothetical protein